MAATLSRCLGTASGSRYRHAPQASAGHVRALPLVKPSRKAVLVRATFSGSSWDPYSSERAKRMWEEVGKAWKSGQFSSIAQGTGGAFFWPGGGFVVGPGSAKSWEEFAKKMQSQGEGQNLSSSPGLPLDVVESKIQYTLYADVPGLSKPDLSIRLSQGNMITISGERKAVADEGMLVQERPVGAFRREWPLPDDADSTAISAKVMDGVLVITVGKKVKEPEVDDSEEIPWMD